MEGEQTCTKIHTNIERLTAFSEERLTFSARGTSAIYIPTIYIACMHISYSACVNALWVAGWPGGKVPAYRRFEVQILVFVSTVKTNIL